MQCYTHSSTPSIGICKNCYRGLCQECVIEIDRSLSCQGSCENEVKQLNLIIQRGKTVYQRSGALTIAMGTIFLLAPFVLDIPEFYKFSIPIGAVLLLSGLYQLKRPKN